MKTEVIAAKVAQRYKTCRGKGDAEQFAQRAVADAKLKAVGLGLDDAGFWAEVEYLATEMVLRATGGVMVQLPRFWRCR